MTMGWRAGGSLAAFLPELPKMRLGNREERTLGKLVRRLMCQDCGQRPVSVIAEHAPSGEREEMLT